MDLLVVMYINNIITPVEPDVLFSLYPPLTLFCKFMQEISSAPPIIESNPMDDCNSSRLLCEDDSGTQISFQECFVGSIYIIVPWTALP